MNSNKSLFVMIACAIAVCIIVPYATQDTVLVTITSKEHVTKGETSKYLIFTDKETFECTDTILFGKFNSSDVYGKIQEGKSYKFKVNGFRIPLFSVYRNIIKVY